jgi:hypothetical protein
MEYAMSPSLSAHAKRVIFAGAVLSAGLSAASVEAAVVFSETFASPTFLGVATPAAVQALTPALGFGSTADSASSELWANTNYYALGGATTSTSVNGWTFAPGSFYAVKTDASGTITNPFNGGVLLNEATLFGPPSSTTAPLVNQEASIAIATTVGQQYTVSIDYWGDNRPGSLYALDVYINDVFKTTSGIKTEVGPGSLTAPNTLLYTFLANSTSTRIGFGQGSTGIAPFSQGSPIIDNLVVTSVPIPAAVWLLASGMVALMGTARRRSAV